MAPGRQKRRGQGGHTLIETMLAAFVFTVGALGLLRLIYSSVEGVTVASKITHAVSLGRGKLDELLSLPYSHSDLSVDSYQDDTNLGPDGTPTTPEGEPTGEHGAQDGWFERTWEVSENDDRTFKTITVNVRWWDEPAKRWRQYSVVGGKSIQ